MGLRNILILFFSVTSVSLVILIVFFSLFFENMDLSFNTKVPESAPLVDDLYDESNPLLAKKSKGLPVEEQKSEDSSKDDEKLVREKTIGTDAFWDEPTPAEEAPVSPRTTGKRAKTGDKQNTEGRRLLAQAEPDKKEENGFLAFFQNNFSPSRKTPRWVQDGIRAKVKVPGEAVPTRVAAPTKPAEGDSEALSEDSSNGLIDPETGMIQGEFGQPDPPVVVIPAPVNPATATKVSQPKPASPTSSPSPSATSGGSQGGLAPMRPSLPPPPTPMAPPVPTPPPGQ